MRETAYTKRATRALVKMPRNEAERIMAKIDQYARAPEELANNVTEMVGEEGKRLRVGEWRVLFVEDETTMRILRVGPRGEVYRD